MPKRLTEAVLRSLKTGKTQEDILHSVTPSAGIRVTRHGRKTFFIKYRSPTVITATGRPAQKRHYFGEHPSGRRGQGVYLPHRASDGAGGEERPLLRLQLRQGTREGSQA